MNSRSERMDPVKRVVEQREKGAADELVRSRQSYLTAQSRLHELIRYRSDYLAEFQYRAEKGMTGNQLQHYKSFLLQLDKAIEKQQQLAEQMSGTMSQQKKNWQSQNQRSNAVKKYQAKMKAHEQRQQTKKEERQAEDDYNNNQHRQN